MLRYFFCVYCTHGVFRLVKTCSSVFSWSFCDDECMELPYALLFSFSFLSLDTEDLLCASIVNSGMSFLERVLVLLVYLFTVAFNFCICGDYVVSLITSLRRSSLQSWDFNFSYHLIMERWRSWLEKMRWVNLFRLHLAFRTSIYTKWVVRMCHKRNSVGKMTKCMILTLKDILRKE